MPAACGSELPRFRCQRLGQLEEERARRGGYGSTGAAAAAGARRSLPWVARARLLSYSRNWRRRRDSMTSSPSEA